MWLWVWPSVCCSVAAEGSSCQCHTWSRRTHSTVACILLWASGSNWVAHCKWKRSGGRREQERERLESRTLHSPWNCKEEEQDRGRVFAWKIPGQPSTEPPWATSETWSAGGAGCRSLCLDSFSVRWSSSTQLKPASHPPAATRFFIITSKLPMELQMILCRRAVGSEPPSNLSLGFFFFLVLPCHTEILHSRVCHSMLLCSFLPNFFKEF